MVSHDELMRFMSNRATVVPAILPCTDAAAANTTGTGVLSSNTDQEDRKITHCDAGAVSRKYSNNEYESSSCNKSGESGSSSKDEESSYNIEAGSSSYNEGGGSSCIEGGRSSYNDAGGNSGSLKVKKPKIMPTFVTPTVKKMSQNDLSPRSKLLNDLRYHKNKPKQVPYGQDTIDPSDKTAGPSDQRFDHYITTAVNQSCAKQPSEQTVFARKSKVEYISPNDTAKDNKVSEGAPIKEGVEMSKDKDIAPKLAGDDIKSFVCEKCHKGFVYIQSLKTHQLKSQCDQNEYVCGQCNKKFKNNKNLRSHVITAHINPKFQCGECLKIFPTQKTVDAHMKHNHMLRECKFCKKLFKNSNGLRSHVHKVHKKKSNGEQVESREENQVILNPEDDSILAKKSTVSKKEIFIKKCCLCGKVYHSRSGYIRHTKKHTQFHGASVAEGIGDNIEVTTSGH